MLKPYSLWTNNGFVSQLVFFPTADEMQLVPFSCWRKSRREAGVKMAVGTLNPVITTLGDKFGCNFIPTGLLMEKKMTQRIERIRVRTH